MDARLPAHLEVSGLLRRVGQEGGFAHVVQKGEREAGTILVVLAEKGGNLRLYERMPSLDGARQWTLSRQQASDNIDQIQEYLSRRADQDRDLWIIELDIADGERFILS